MRSNDLTVWQYLRKHMTEWPSFYLEYQHIISTLSVAFAKCQISPTPPLSQITAKPASPLHRSLSPAAPQKQPKTSNVSDQHIMPARPAILDSRLIRVICPLKQRSRCLATAAHQLPRNQPWSHSPASTSIDNDQVARLASRPLHPLTLADLVRLAPPESSLSAASLTYNPQTWPSPTLRIHSIHLCEFHPLPPAYPPRPPHPSPPQPPLYCRLESAHLTHLQQLHPLPLHLAPLPRAANHHARR